MTNIIPYQIKSYYIIFELLTPRMPEELVHNYDITNTTADITCNFDYQRLLTGYWDIYIDIGLREMPIGTMLYRTGFEFPSFMQDCDSIFSHETIAPLVNTALQCSIDEFKEVCIEHEFATPVKLVATDKIIQAFTNKIIEQYWNSRKSDDEANYYMLHNVGLQCDSGNDTIITLMGTFIILDELFYSNPFFNHKHNREVFSSVMSMSKYNTLKYNCAGIENESITLSIFHAIMFYQCLDCALKMLLSSRADELIPFIERKGMNSTIRERYFKLGTAFFNKLHESLEASNARILDLEEMPDWTNLIR